MGPTCSELARSHEESVVGTAPLASGWVLVEQPGSWSRAALGVAAGNVAAAATGMPVRVQAIRRPWIPEVADSSGAPPVGRGTGRTVLLAHAGATPWLERLVVPQGDDLRWLDPSVCTRAHPPGLGEHAPGPVVLVCTHGSRDRCCASLGRPIANTLATLHPDEVWEVSHIGGHRFAANLVLLPDGLVHGGLDVSGAVAAVDAHHAGRLRLSSLRGRSSLDRPAQAAEVLVRLALGADQLDAVTNVEVGTSVVDGAAATGTQDVTVVVRLAGTDHEVRVRHVPTGAARQLSCDADEPEDPGRWTLVSLTPGSVTPGSDRRSP